MKRLTAILCLTLAVLLGGAGVSFARSHCPKGAVEDSKSGICVSSYLKLVGSYIPCNDLVNNIYEVHKRNIESSKRNLEDKSTAHWPDYSKWKEALFTNGVPEFKNE